MPRGVGAGQGVDRDEGGGIEQVGHHANLNGAVGKRGFALESDATVVDGAIVEIGEDKDDGFLGRTHTIAVTVVYIVEMDEGRIHGMLTVGIGEIVVVDVVAERKFKSGGTAEVNRFNTVGIVPQLFDIDFAVIVEGESGGGSDDVSVDPVVGTMIVGDAVTGVGSAFEGEV